MKNINNTASILFVLLVILYFTGGMRLTESEQRKTTTKTRNEKARPKKKIYIFIYAP